MSLMIMQRDPDYYFDDGNVLLCAENVEFRVHKSRLSASAPAFRTFTTPQDGTAADDLKAIPLLGVSSKSFRVFLRTLYGGPEEILELFRSPPSGANVVELLDLAHVAHLYMAAKIESMAVQSLGAFLEHCAAGPAQKIETPFCGALLEYISVIGRGALREKLEAQVLTALHALDLTAVLDACERDASAASQNIHAAALGIALQREAFPWPTYSKAQRTQMLVGYHRLTKAWYDFATSVRPGTEVCGPVQEAWTRALHAPAVHSRPPEDFLGRLDTMCKQLELEKAEIATHNGCENGCPNWAVALGTVTRERERVVTEMRSVDYFSLDAEDSLALAKPKAKLKPAALLPAPPIKDGTVATLPSLLRNDKFSFSCDFPSTSPPTSASSASIPPIFSSRKPSVEAPAKQPIDAPAKQPVGAPAKQPVGAPAKQPIAAPAKQPVNGSATQGKAHVAGKEVKFTRVKLPASRSRDSKLLHVERKNTSVSGEDSDTEDSDPADSQDSEDSTDSD